MSSVPESERSLMIISNLLHTLLNVAYFYI